MLSVLLSIEKFRNFHHCSIINFALHKYWVLSMLITILRGGIDVFPCKSRKGRFMMTFAMYVPMIRQSLPFLSFAWIAWQDVLNLQLFLSCPNRWLKCDRPGAVHFWSPFLERLSFWLLLVGDSIRSLPRAGWKLFSKVIEL